MNDFKLIFLFVYNCKVLVYNCLFFTMILMFINYFKIFIVYFWHFTEKGDISTKIEALKKTIHLILNGEKFPTILMTIIRFVLPLQDHTIKKLLLIFWEIVPKTTTDGKLMQEMILVCDAYRKVCNPLLYCFKLHFKGTYVFSWAD